MNNHMLLFQTRILTEADKKPQFVYVHTLTKGDVFVSMNNSWLTVFVSIDS